MTARRCAKVLAGGFQVSWLACCEGRPDIAVAGFLFERMCLLPAFVLWQLPLVGCWAVVGLSCRFLYMRCCHVSQQRFNDDNMLITDRHLFSGWYDGFRNYMMHFCRQYLWLICVVLRRHHTCPSLVVRNKKLWVSSFSPLSLIPKNREPVGATKSY